MRPKSKILIFITCLLVVPLSIFLNREEPVINLLQNFFIPILCIYIVLFFRNKNKKLFNLVFVIGTIWFIYLCLYYLFGLFNRHW